MMLKHAVLVAAYSAWHTALPRAAEAAFASTQRDNHIAAGFYAGAYAACNKFVDAVAALESARIQFGQLHERYKDDAAFCKAYSDVEKALADIENIT